MANTLEAVFTASSGRAGKGTIMSHSISALYESHSNASSARRTLIAAGLARDGIRLIVGAPSSPDDRDEPEELIPGADALCRFFQEMGLHQEEWAVYRRAMACGGAMLSFPMPETGGERLIDILKDNGSLDVEGRIAAWRAEGWGGTSPVSTEGWGGYSATSTGGRHVTVGR
ncbi:hypothetical protein PUR29_33490 [Methylobacterium ajmalii]|uniref:Uncharacterized protein n=1 Tax=Methylobacterium ajmalii TaxID=2738439 RepID=A0ABV0A3Y1_9HYPH